MKRNVKNLTLTLLKIKILLVNCTGQLIFPALPDPGVKQLSMVSQDYYFGLIAFVRVYLY